MAWYCADATRKRKLVLKDRAYWDLHGHQNASVFASELPDTNGLGQPLAAYDFRDRWNNDAHQVFHHLCKKHEGELKETHGRWVALDARSLGARDGYFMHPQLAMSSQQAKLNKKPSSLPRGSRLLVQNLDSVGDTTCWRRGEDGAWQVREARVFSFAELCFTFGHRYTMRELYWYYCGARVIFRTREHPQPNAEKHDARLLSRWETGSWDIRRHG